jgi:hypothetical protein
MGLNNTEQALLIILSTFLAIFLILGITALIYLIQIQKTVKKVVKKIENVTDKAERVTDVIENSAPIMGIIKYFSKMHKDNKHKN